MGSRADLFFLYIFPFSLLMVLPLLLKKAYGEKHCSQAGDQGAEKTLFQRMDVIFALCAFWLVACVSYTWAIAHTLSVGGRIDHALLFQGTGGDGNPYVNSAQVSTPVLYALLRLLVIQFGDGTFETHQLRLIVLSYSCASLLLTCVLLDMRLQFKRVGTPSVLKIAAFLSVCAIGLVPISKDIAVGNVNIWVASFVAAYLFLWNGSDHGWADFTGGLFLGIACMVKPYLLLVFVFLFFFCLRRRNFSTLCGLAAGMSICFFGSLFIPGIGLDSYQTFFTEVPRQFLNQHIQLTTNNLSLTQYVPQSWKRMVAPFIFSFLSLIALMASKKSEREDVMVWFFITNLCYPIIWVEHLTAIIPAALFLILKKDDYTAILTGAIVVNAIFFAGIWKLPPLVAGLLILAWAWQIRKRLSIEIPFTPSSPFRATSAVVLNASVQESATAMSL